MSENPENYSKILSQFSTEENLLQEKLQLIQSKRQELQRRSPTPLNFDSLEDVYRTKRNALNRNKALKTVESELITTKREISILMSKLRSKRCYNPAEDNLNKIIDKYSEILSREGITYMSDIRETRPRNGLKPYKRSPSGRFWCSSFRLNNNNIVTVQGISDIVQQIFEIPENLTWLDLSFNKLTYLHQEISELRNLKIFYLHGNMFSQFGPVLYHLQGLDKLYSLTLHGNPIEGTRGYRQRVLSVLPKLKNLDFTNVTNSDLENTDYNQISKSSR